MNRACVKQRGNELLVTADMSKGCVAYFALDHPLAEICARFLTIGDERGARLLPGLRTYPATEMECLRTFICSR